MKRFLHRSMGHSSRSPAVMRGHALRFTATHTMKR
jgi:hypothetical protein